MNTACISSGGRLDCRDRATAAEEGSRWTANSFKIADGVQCEACHGAGSDYAKMHIMKDLEKAKAAGLIIPDEKTCLTCHNNEGPNFESFDYELFFEMIAHPRPPKVPDDPEGS